MTTITIELPDTTPIMSIIEFANSLSCDAQLSGRNHFTFQPNQAPISRGNVTAFRTARAVAANEQPTPPPAA